MHIVRWSVDYLSCKMSFNDHLLYTGRRPCLDDHAHEQVWPKFRDIHPIVDGKCWEYITKFTQPRIDPEYSSDTATLWYISDFNDLGSAFSIPQAYYGKLWIILRNSACPSFDILANFETCYVIKF